MNMFLHRALTVACLHLALAGPVPAAQVEFTTTPLGGSQWQVEYLLVNDEAQVLEELTIWFDPALYASLVRVSSSPEWDALLVQPDPALPADGFLDLLSLTGGLAAGEAAGGFVLAFDFSGTGQPGSQSFDVVDPLTLELRQQGRTIPRGVELPEPASVVLAGGALGLLAIVGGLRRRKVGAPPAGAIQGARP